MYVCLWSPDWSTAAASGAEPDPGEEGDVARAPDPVEVGPYLAEHAPRVRVEPVRVWADGRGLDAEALARTLLRVLAEHGVAARAGVAAVPVVAALAARWGAYGSEDGAPTPFLVKERTGWGWRRPGSSEATAASGPGSSDVGRARSAGVPGPGPAPDPPADAVVSVPRGEERPWLAGLPVVALEPGDRLRPLLEGVGIRTLGDLAALEREAVEVRFGPDAVALWRWARADDRRMLFDPVPPERPCGSIDFVDYVLTDPARLIFTANALLGPLCEGLVARGEHARALRLTLPLANGEAWERALRPARPTASRDGWLRMVRGLFERLTVPDAVAGMRIEVGATEEAAVHQGDLFDRGFATASAVEAAVARLADRKVYSVEPVVDAHPLVERRGRWIAPDSVGEGGVGEPGVGRAVSPGAGGAGAGSDRGLTLQLLPEPRPVVVESRDRRDHRVPTRIRDRGGWRQLLLAAGPDRISGGQWEGEAYAREYYRCITDDGTPLWLFRDALEDRWYLQGWWD